MDTSRIDNKWPVAREGIPFIVAGLFLTLLSGALGVAALALLMGVLSLFTIFFFRDPERKNTCEERAVLTPADGTILKIERFPEGDNPLGKPAVKISIFMSIFNVHVNRIPVEGTVVKVEYHPGRFFSANLDKASKYNEKNSVTLMTPNAGPIVVIQIAGLIARRIACWVRERDEVVAGQRFGLIRFGSRLEVYLPLESRIVIRPRDKVKAGETIIGYLP
ncbi:MAG: phosphatidylserine decarboxylase family protein [Deltaproteobacteria bacterium]|nr:MAG: phosphatidylserine decarboxylase family protein [Deltaproteobacteria bacterium]